MHRRQVCFRTYTKLSNVSDSKLGNNCKFKYHIAWFQRINFQIRFLFSSGGYLYSVGLDTSVPEKFCWRVTPNPCTCTKLNRCQKLTSRSLNMACPLLNLFWQILNNCGGSLFHFSSLKDFISSLKWIIRLVGHGISQPNTEPVMELGRVPFPPLFEC